MDTVVPIGRQAAKLPKTRITARLWNLRGDRLAAIGGFLQLFSLALPWYALGQAGDVPRPGPNGASLGAATAVVIAYFMLVILGAGIRNPVVNTVFSLAQIAFLGLLMSQAFIDPPALMSEPCPETFPVRNYCNYIPPIYGPDSGIFVAFVGAFLSLAGGLREVDPYARRRRAATTSLTQTLR